jgi:hypothetical protein
MGRCPDLVAAKSAPKKQFCRLALLRSVQRPARTESAVDQFTGNLDPVAVEAFHGGRNGLAVQTMRSQLGTDPQWAETSSGASAHQVFREAAIVLPTGGLELLDCSIRLLASDASRPQLAREFALGVLAPNQQAQGALRRRGLKPFPPTSRRWLRIRLRRWLGLGRSQLFRIT